MPNWCYTTVAVYGNGTKESEHALDLITNAVIREQETDRGPGILECAESFILEAFGIKTDELSCRGSITSVRRDMTRNVMFLECEDAWAPHEDTWDTLTAELNKRDNVELSYVYIAEEPLMGVYVNTDIRGKYFSTRYKLDFMVSDDIPELGMCCGDEANDYFDSEADVVKFMNHSGCHKTDGSPFLTIQDVQSELKLYDEKFEWLTIAEYSQS